MRWWGAPSELRNFFLDCEVVPFLGKTDGPFVSFAIIFKTCHEFDLTRFLSLPSKMDNTTARVGGLFEVPFLHTLVEKAESVEYRALPRGVCPNEQIQIVQGDSFVAQAPVSECFEA